MKSTLLVLSIPSLLFFGCSTVPQIHSDTACMNALQKKYEAKVQSEMIAARLRKQTRPDPVPEDSVMNEAFREKQGDFRHCYADKLGRRSHEEGTLTVKVLFDASGKVEQSCVRESNYDSPEYEQCILDVVNGIQMPMPPPGRSFTASYSLEVQVTSF